MKGIAILIGSAYLGQLVYNQFLSPKFKPGLATDLSRAATVAGAVMLVRKFVK